MLFSHWIARFVDFWYRMHQVTEDRRAKCNPLREVTCESSVGRFPVFCWNKANNLETALLFLHRSFFVQALADSPWDPLRSPLRQSFLTAYHSATRILDASRTQFAHEPAVCARVFRIWTFAFCAAVRVVLSLPISPLTRVRAVDYYCYRCYKAADGKARPGTIHTT